MTRYLSFLVAMGLLLTSCQPSTTPPEQEIPVATNTIQPTQMLSADANLLLEDDFSDSTSGWPIMGDKTNGELGYENGFYRIAFYQPAGFQAAWSYKKFDDFIVETRVCTSITDENIGAGLTLRTSEKKWYIFWVYPNSQEYIFFKSINEEFSGLIPLTESAAIKPVEENDKLCLQLKAAAHGDTFDFWVSSDGGSYQYLASVQDASMDSGFLGPAADGPKQAFSSSPIMAMFDWIKVTRYSEQPIIEANTEETKEDLLMNDDFTDPTTGWPTMGDEVTGKVGYQNGSYRIAFYQPGGFQAAWSIREYDDFIVETRVCTSETEPGIGAGLTLRTSEKKWYLFWVYPASREYLFTRGINDEYTDLLPLARSEAIQPERINGRLCYQIKAAVHGSEFDFWISGDGEEYQFLASAQDDSLSTGRLGPAADAPKSAFSPTPVEALFDWIKVYPYSEQESEIAQSNQPSSNCTNRADLIGESHVDEKTYPTQVGFTKTWIVKNNGTCTWTGDYSLNYVDGQQMSSISTQNLIGEVKPGENAMVSVDMTTPVDNGTFTSRWILENAAGTSFGWGSNADQYFEVSIEVDANVTMANDPGSLNFVGGANLDAMGGGEGDFVDSDTDGLSDGLEEWLANTFVPYVEYDEHEDQKQNEIMRLYQVTPIYKTYPEYLYHLDYQFPAYSGPPGVLLTYVYLYKWDSGDPTWGAQDHAGDAEMIRIFVVNPRDSINTWIPAAIIIKRHNDDPMFYYPGETGYGYASMQWIDGSHLRVFASEDKHAFYVFEEECEHYSNFTKFSVPTVNYFEDCGGGFKIDSQITNGVDGFNVGERLTHSISVMPDNPQGLFKGECIWAGEDCIEGSFDTSEDFCGGYYKYNADFDLFGVGPLCGGGLSGKWWPQTDANIQNYLYYFLGQAASQWYISQYGAQYEICFYTGDLDQAETDLQVHVTLWGNRENLDLLKNQPLNWQTMFNVRQKQYVFYKNMQQCYEAGSYNMNEEISGIQLDVYNTNPNEPMTHNTEWYLQDVSVTDKFSQERWLFPVWTWIDFKNNFDTDINEMVNGPAVYFAVSADPTSPLTPYDDPPSSP